MQQFITIEIQTYVPLIDLAIQPMSWLLILNIRRRTVPNEYSKYK